MNHQELAAAYMDHYRTGSESESWAFDEVVDACNELEEGIKITFSLIELSENDAELAYVAAGPVEDLLKWHGKKAIPYFENASVYSEKVRKALAGVWINEKYEAFTEWKKLMVKFGYLKTKKKQINRKRK